MSLNYFVDSNKERVMATEEYKPLQVREAIRSELRQLPETRWIQNLRHPSYHLRQPIPILIKREGDVVTANYDDLDLSGKGEDVKAAISDLCGKIVACYESKGACTNQKGDSPTQEHTFLRQIVIEIQPELVSSKLWNEVKQFYRDKLEVIPDVQKGYIKQEPEYVRAIILVSGHSVKLLEQLAKIDLEINRKFRPLCFYIEYERSLKHLDLDDLERFY